MSKILYYFTFGKNNVNCFEKNSCTLEINLAKQKLTLKSLDRTTELITVVYDHFLQIKNHLYIFDITHDNDIVIIFPVFATDVCSRVFNILNEKMIQTTIDSNDLFKTRFLKTFCRRYLASSSNEMISEDLSDEITSAFEGLKEEDIFLNMLLEQDQENRTVAMQPQASECSQVYTISDDEDDDSDTISKSSDEGYTVPDDDSDSNSELDKEISSTSNGQHEIIRAPLFEHCLSRQGNPVLMVYSSNKKSLFYKLPYDSCNKCYRCYRCKSLGKYVNAILELDEDDNEIVVLRGGPHKCTLIAKESSIHNNSDEVSKRGEKIHTEERVRFGDNNKNIEGSLLEKNQENSTSLTTRKRKHISSISQSKTIRPPMYKRAVTEAGNPKLLVLDSNNTNLAYQYLYNRHNGYYFCSECNKLKMWNSATLHYDSNGEEYVLLRNPSHICAPMFNFDTFAMMPRPRSCSKFRNSRGHTFEPQDSDDDTSEEDSSLAYKKAYFSSKNVNDKAHSVTKDNNTDEHSPSRLQIIEPRQVLYPVQDETPDFVVKSGNFRFEQSKFLRIQNGALLVADSHGLEYRYCYNRKKKEFICAPCKNRFSHRVAAYWCKDINGEEFLRLGKHKLNHKCNQ